MLNICLLFQIFFNFIFDVFIFTNTLKYLIFYDQFQLDESINLL